MNYPTLALATFGQRYTIRGSSPSKSAQPVQAYTSYPRGAITLKKHLKIVFREIHSFKTHFHSQHIF